MKFKRNIYQGYKGYSGTKLDQTECELYDDIPTEDHKELMLRILAGGQVAEERKRAMYYDDDHIDDDDDENGNDLENFDYIQAYQTYRENKINLFKQKQQTEIKQQEQQKAENPPTQDK